MIADKLAVGISLLIILIIYYFFKKFLSFPAPYLSFSSVVHLEVKQQGREKGMAWIHTLKWISLICLLAAFANPQLKLPSLQQSVSTSSSLPTEGIALYLVLDQSGSMNQLVETSTPEGQAQYMRKMDLLKEVTESFIQQETSNLIGLVTFARIPRILVPLTLDQTSLLNQVRQLTVIQDKDQDGTGIGYAIFKTANLIAATRHFAEDLRNKEKSPYEIKGSAIIVVTDGLQNTSPLDAGNRLRTMDLDEAADYAKSQGIRLYLINIDPTISSPQFAPHRRLMTRITEITGGRFYLASQPQDLQGIYQAISQIEKGRIESPQVRQNKEIPTLPLYPFLLGLSLVILFISIIMETRFFKTVP